MLLSQMHGPSEWNIIGCKVLCKQWLFAPWRTLGPHIFFSATLLQTSSHHFHGSKMCILFCLNDSVIIRVSVSLPCFCSRSSFTESYHFSHLPLSTNGVVSPLSYVPSLCCFVRMCLRAGTCLGCVCVCCGSCLQVVRNE